MTTVNDYNVKELPQWCPGCGNFLSLSAIKNAFAELNLDPKNTVVVSGIGCGSKVPHYICTYGYEGIHGRLLPLASGIKLSNRKLTVVGMGGDGDGYGEGVQHFTHIARRNYDLTYIVHNNQIYGLTTGQMSPTTEKGQKTKTSPFGAIETQFNPLANAIINGATYVARGYSADLEHLKTLIKGAIQHKGFALVDVFQPCVTFNKHNNYDWFKERVYKLEESEHDSTNKEAALEKCFEDIKTDYKKLPIGLLYKENRATYEDQLPQLKEKELVDHSLEINMEKFYEEFE